MSLSPFHVAFAVTSLEATRAFYVDVLGCEEGRSTARWIDFSLFGHQLSAHLRPQIQPVVAGEVDDDAVPIPHMGVVLPWAQWATLADRIRDAGVPFLLAPKVRFAGEPGEQGTFFVKDPSGNGLEFKGFRDLGQLFVAG